MTMYAGDEFYDDDITSGLIGGDSDLWDDVDDGRYDDDLSPYDGTYSED